MATTDTTSSALAATRKTVPQIAAALPKRSTRAPFSGLARVLVAGVAAATLLSATGSGALADNANINEMIFNVSTPYNTTNIDVVSSDGVKWDTIRPSQLTFWAHMKIDTQWPGYVDQLGVFLGHCNGSQCGNGYPLLYYASPAARDYNHQGNIAFSTAKIPLSTTGIAIVPYGDQILKECNAHLQPDGATKLYSFSQPMTVSLSANTQTSVLKIPPAEVHDPEIGPVFNGGDQTRQSAFSANVACKPFAKPAGDVAAKQPANLSVGSIQLFRSTYAHANSQPNAATQCKKARWLVRLNTNKAGPVKFKLWTKIGDAPMTSKVIDAWASFDGDSKYKAEYVQWTEVTKTTSVQAKAEDMTNAIGQSTEWKDITLHCTGIAGGGLADVPNTGNPDDGVNPVPLKVTGELTLADKDGAPKDKPRLGAAVFKIWATKPGSTSYKLTCSGGRNWEGTLPTFKVADKKYQAVGLHNFQIDKTEQIGCALRSTSLPKDPVIAVATQLFKLIKRNPDVGGADKESDTPKPTHDKADAGRPATLVDQARPQKPDVQKPGIKVAPVNKLSCAGGKVSGDTCFCPAGTQKVQAAPNAFRCVKQIARPEGLTRPSARLPTPSAAQRQTFKPAPREVVRPAQRQTSAPQRPARFIR